MENKERPSGKEQKMCPNRFSDIKTQMKQGPKTEGGGANMYVLCSSVQSTDHWINELMDGQRLL